MFKSQSLLPEILHIVNDKGTEYPFTGIYNHFDTAGTYLCRQCGIALFRSETKFNSACGWPSFDDEIANKVIKEVDADGVRTEILCKRCHAHLGHVFYGEAKTAKNTRYCVNSLSLDFVNDLKVEDTEEAIFAAGCFWGVEFLLQQLPGVLKTEVGYTGGQKRQPTYQDVVQGDTGHVESIRVLYDPKVINYESVARFFFEIHDPTQTNGQGPDLGTQYLSVIFYYNDAQKKVSEKLIKQLAPLKIATKIVPVSVFWPAEDYHQNYYKKKNQQPYCHFYTKRF